MSHDIAANKTLALHLLSTIEVGGDITLLLSDDATWWVPDHCAMGGMYTIQELTLAMSGLFSLFRAPPQFRINHVTAEADRVAIDCESTITLHDGTVYTNTYHFLMLVRDGKIFSVKEFLNTAGTNQILSLARQLVAGNGAEVGDGR